MGKHFVKDVWKPIWFCYWKYHISNLGNIKSIYSISKKGKITFNEIILKPFTNSKGYVKVKLNWLDIKGKRHSKTYSLSRLVATAFIPNPHNKPEVNHKDLNKLNNRYTNLEWATSKENTNHAQANGARPIAKLYVRNGFTFKYA